MMKTSKHDTISQPVRLKHVPLRTCIACRQTASKRDLIRLVSTIEGVVIDSKGRKPGRGVYLCPVRECWENGLKGNRIEFGLRTKLSPENRQMLFAYGKDLPGKEDRS